MAPIHVDLGEESVPLDFLKRRPGPEPAAAGVPQPVVSSITLPEEIVAQDHQLRLNFAGKSSEGVRMEAGSGAISELPAMLGGLAQAEIEVVEPLPIEFSPAPPAITHPSAPLQC